MPELCLEFASFRKAQLALGQCGREEFFDLRLFAVACHCQLADQQIAGALQHFLLPERKWLRLVERDQALQHACHFDQGTSAHAVRVFFEPVFPVAAPVCLAQRQKIDHLLDLAVPDHSSKADASRVIARDHDLQAAGLDVEQIEPFDRSANGSAADLLDDSYSMVGIDDFVTNVEVQIGTTHIRHPVGGGLEGKQRKVL